MPRPERPRREPPSEDYDYEVQFARDEGVIRCLQVTVPAVRWKGGPGRPRRPVVVVLQPAAAVDAVPDALLAEALRVVATLGVSCTDAWPDRETAAALDAVPVE